MKVMLKSHLFQNRKDLFLNGQLALPDVFALFSGVQSTTL